MQFTRLRLHGFKSFVERTDLPIEPGLTGIVGPNGCGKSNLIEALRWTMGETSARKLRGGGMEDVIFAGTSRRASRNIAEVILSLDNSDRTAPAAFNSFTQLEVSRAIRRGAGSDYRVNGRAARARDVQQLFADQGTGSGAASIVSQGQIGTLINAKPGERRQILEEAAGISGLQSRRSDAESRLRGTRANLERVGDLLAQLEARAKRLASQVEQAQVYRALSEEISRAQLTLAWLGWRAVRQAASDADRAFDAADHAVAGALLAESEALAAADANQAALPGLREASAQAAARARRLATEQEEARQALNRAQAALKALDRQQADLTQDQAREATLLEDAASALARLEQEKAHLDTAEQVTAAPDPAELDALSAQVAERDQALEQARFELAEAEAQAALSVRAAREAEETRRLLNQRREARGTALRHAEAALAALPAIGPLAAVSAEAAAASQQAEAALETAQGVAEDAKRAAREAAAAERDAATRLAELTAESKSVATMVRQVEPSGPTLADGLPLPAGLEAALDAAFGEALLASPDAAAPLHWLPRPDLPAPPLPDGVSSLASRLTGDHPLRSVLAWVGLVADRAQGRHYAGALRPGQALVSHQGDLWRWDGYGRHAGALSAAGQLLALRARHHALETSVREAAAVHARAAEALRTAQMTAREAEDAKAAAQTALRQASREADQAERVAQQAQRDRATLVPNVEALRVQVQETEADLAALPPPPDPTRAPATGPLRNRVQSLHADLARARDERDRLTAQANAAQAAERQRAQQIERIQGDSAQWQQRLAGTEARRRELASRQGAIDARRADLAGKPEQLRRRLEALEPAVTQAVMAEREAASTLAQAESDAQGAGQRLRGAQHALSAAKEARATAQAELKHALEAKAAQAEDIQERYGVAPDSLAHQLPAEVVQTPPEPDPLRRALARAVRERDALGPVNLQAAQEFEALETERRRVADDVADLQAAVDRLEAGLKTLNQEARERLHAAFTQVNEAFGEVFRILFRGGQARLSLLEPEALGDDAALVDPLAFGLEIFASPPGKAMRSLSLLSGGEQALTALALLTAIFRCNPAPICVLDEVDAPLDDANVDRFCGLLDHLASDGATRFLVITHHRMTMARMDRLFGVTMAEQGVSQLVSVSLNEAAEMVDV